MNATHHHSYKIHAEHNWFATGGSGRGYFETVKIFVNALMGWGASPGVANSRHVGVDFPRREQLIKLRACGFTRDTNWQRDVEKRAGPAGLRSCLPVPC
jgi:hypothetical protein